MMSPAQVMLVCFVCTVSQRVWARLPQWTRPADSSDYEVIRLFKLPSKGYTFEAFGNKYSLNLVPNRYITSPNFEAYLVDGDERIVLPLANTTCNYIHFDESSAAAFDFCDPDEIKGLVMTEDSVLEIQPMLEDYGQLIDEAQLVEGDSFHLVKRSSLVPNGWTEQLKKIPEAIHNGTIEKTKRLESKKASKLERPMVELGLFFDQAAYSIFAPFFKNDDVKLTNMLLAYINGVQALYHHSSAGSRIDLMLTHLELFKSQPKDLPAHGGERSELLNSFCNYNEVHNPSSDEDPKHWDMGLYISGLDFYAMENGKKSGVTMGLATVGGVCQAKYACVIAEFGVTSVFGKPYPSAGFTSVYVLAHEIGHNLGLNHDSTKNNCPKDGFIMSPSRGVDGETLWSSCSASKLQELSGWAKCLYDSQKPDPKMDHSTMYKDNPGSVWGPKKQCEVLLRDQDATYIGDDKKEVPEICRRMQCRTPHRTGYYDAGPALDGTPCGDGKWCKGGSCIPISVKGNVYEYVSGGWSNWKSGRCRSGCLLRSKGFQSMHRECNNPSPVSTIDGCKGLSYKVNLCSDDKVCKYKKRISSMEYASRKCYEFNQYIPELDKYGSGLQAPHEGSRLWVACAIFCRKEESGMFYSPRVELNDLGVDPYFPDGTWCHYDGQSDYFCLQHHCLPQNFQLSKDSLWIDDLQIMQNALPHPQDLPLDLQKYLSLDPNGRPISTSFEEQTLSTPREDDWATRDYVEISEMSNGVH